ncbi:hypothetical protein KA005_59020 [bacterium]|nr:hypothetical protein [bacterium]
MTHRKPIPEELTARLREIIAQANWIFAKTYATTAPHEYCLREDMDRGDVPTSNMLLLADCIWEYGYKERYKSYMQTYVDIDDHKYWSMDPTPEKTDLINRVPLTEEGIAELCRNQGVLD